MKFTSLLVAYVAGTLTVAVTVWSAAFLLTSHQGLQDAVRAWTEPDLVEEMAAREMVRETWEPIGSYVSESTLRQAARPVGKIQINYEGSDQFGVCTGSIVDEFTILTAYHCIQPPSDNPSLTVASIQIIFDFLSSDDPLGRFTEDGELRIFNLDPSFFIDGATPDGSPADFILLRSTGNFLNEETQSEIDPSLIWGTIPMSPEDLTPSPGVRPLVIIHHPRKRLPMQISRYSCHANGDRKIPGDLSESYGHSCATERGSSGAPIFSQEDLQLIGIHRGSIRGALTARTNTGILPNFNVFSGVHDMLHKSVSQDSDTSSGKFAEIVLAQHADLRARYGMQLARKQDYRQAPRYAEAVESNLAALTFEVPTEFATERLGQLHIFSDAPAVFTCNALYLGGGFILTPYHCVRSNMFRSGNGLFRFSGLSDLRIAKGIETELPTFETPLAETVLHSEELDYAIFEISGLSQFVELFSEEFEDVFSPLVVNRNRPALSEKVDLLYLNQSNTLTRLECRVVSNVESDEKDVSYDCESNVESGGGSGGVVIDEQGAAVAIHMYRYNTGVRAGLHLGLIADELDSLGVGIAVK